VATEACRAPPPPTQRPTPSAEQPLTFWQPCAPLSLAGAKPQTLSLPPQHPGPASHLPPVTYEKTLHMARQTKHDDSVTRRREVVSRLHLLGYTVRQITAMLPEQDPPILNSADQPFSHMTVQADIEALRELSRQNALQDIQAAQQERLARLRFYEVEALQHIPDKKDSLQTAMQAHDRIAKLQGLNAPERVEQTGTQSLTVEFVHTGQQETPAVEGGDD